MDVFAQIAVKIIKAQEAIIGPVAVEQAQQVSGLSVDWSKQEVVITGNETTALDQLVKQYQELFGQISVEVSKESAASLLGQLPGDQLPEALK
jgi:nitric oxide reductase large subunit